MLNQSFFGYKPDWIKYMDESTELGSVRISQRKFWTGLGLQKSQICLKAPLPILKSSSPVPLEKLAPMPLEKPAPVVPLEKLAPLKKVRKRCQF